MQFSPENLPDDIPSLKGMVISFHGRTSALRVRHTAAREMENKLLREQVLLMKAKLFGRKSEKLSPRRSPSSSSSSTSLPKTWETILIVIRQELSRQ